jgi:hypothetical protein
MLPEEGFVIPEISKSMGPSALVHPDNMGTLTLPLETVHSTGYPEILQVIVLP